MDTKIIINEDRDARTEITIHGPEGEVLRGHFDPTEEDSFLEVDEFTGLEDENEVLEILEAAFDAFTGGDLEGDPSTPGGFLADWDSIAE